MIGLVMATAAIALAAPVGQPALASFHDTENPAVRIRAEISADGVALRCTAPKSNVRKGDPVASQQVCDLVMHSRFVPGHDGSGAAVASLIDAWYQKRQGAWVQTEAPQWSTPDLSFEVTKMPAELPAFAKVELRVIVATDGHFEACEPVSDKLKPSTAAFFCGEARKESAAPVRDASGAPMRSAQPFHINAASSAAMDRVMATIPR